MAFKFQRLRTLCPKHTTKLLWSNALAPNKRQPNWFHRHRFQSIANHCGGCMHILQSMFSLFQVKTLDATRAFYCFLSIYEATWDARRFDFALKGISIPSFNYNYNNNNDDDDVDDDNSGINDVIFSILCIRFAAWFLSFDQFGSLTPHRALFPSEIQPLLAMVWYNQNWLLAAYDIVRVEYCHARRPRNGNTRWCFFPIFQVASHSAPRCRVCVIVRLSFGFFCLRCSCRLFMTMASCIELGTNVNLSCFAYS